MYLVCFFRMKKKKRMLFLFNYYFNVSSIYNLILRYVILFNFWFKWKQKKNSNKFCPTTLFFTIISPVLTNERRRKKTYLNLVYSFVLFIFGLFFSFFFRSDATTAMIYDSHSQIGIITEKKPITLNVLCPCWKKKNENKLQFITIILVVMSWSKHKLLYINLIEIYKLLKQSEEKNGERKRCLHAMGQMFII